MKVLLERHIPAGLAPGGAQIQVDRTLAALTGIGVTAEYLRWWDAGQSGDLIHYFGTCNNDYLNVARNAGRPVVLTTLFSETCNRSRARLARQGWLTRSLLSLPFGGRIKQQLSWQTYHNCAHNIVGLDAERRVLQMVYRVPSGKISTVPLGLPDVYLNAGAGDRSAELLVCVGTITAQKNSVPLARLARAAQVPVLFVGKPYAESEPYWQEFRGLVDGRWVRHQPHLADPVAMVALLHRARGAVVMSDFENWSLTAHEAAACGLPLLLPDLNWSRERFGNQAHYFDRIGFHPRNVEILKQFYHAAPGLPAPAVKLFSWTEVAGQLKTVYERVLNAKKDR
jgi:glycosyltransferase involved in cell wall biosynthesis